MVTQPPPRKTVLIPRPRAAGEAFAAALPSVWTGVVAPVMEIRFLDITLPDQAGAKVIFTSRNAVEALGRLGPIESGIEALCVGQKTAEAARSLGFDVSTVAPDAAVLLAQIAARPGRGRFFHPHGRHTRGGIVAALHDAGHSVTEAVLYEQAPVALERGIRADCAAGRFDALALFSPRTAALLFEQVTVGDATRVLCLSRAVAQVAERHGIVRAEIALQPDQAAMVALLGRK